MQMRGGALRAETAANQEILLQDYVARLAKSPTGRLAAYLHLSRLNPNNRREHHLRIAVSSFDPLIKKYDGQLFHLGNDDLVVVVKDAPYEQFEEVVGKVRYLFSDDPLATNLGEEPGFATHLDVARDYMQFRALADAAVRQAEERKRARQRANGQDDERPKQPLTPQVLGKLETGLANMDLTTLLRRQPVAALLPNLPPRVVFNEIYVSIPELCRRVMPDVDIASAPLLFQHLTQILDQRVLAHLPGVDAHVPTATSVNLNIATLLTPFFQTFDAKLRQATQKTVVFEFQPGDVFRDIAGFTFAREFARERGYRLCLDGLNHLSYPLLPIKDMGFDLEKIVWASDLAYGGPDPRRERFRQAVREANPARLVLCRCDGPEAVEFGQSLGVTLFQGRYIDRLLTGTAGTEAGGLPVG